MLKLLKRLQASSDWWFLLITSVLFFFIRLPSFFEPYWYGDEGIYEVLGFGIRHGRLLYRDIWDNKPPLLYIIYALFNGDQMPVRIFSFFVGLTATIIFFFLTKKLFTKKTAQYSTTIIFALLLGLPLLEGNIANAENFMILPSVSAALLIVHLIQKKTIHMKSYLFLGIAGFLLGLSFLIKVVAIFDVAAFWIFLFILTFQVNDFIKTFKQAVMYTVVFAASFFLPLLITIFFFVAQGALKIFLQSAFFSNVGYVNYGNQFIIPQGLLVAKLILLIGICVFLFLKKNHLSKTHLFIYLWLSFSVFSALFSQRPYTHYLLVLVASTTLFLGLLLEDQKQKVIHVVILVLLVIFVTKNFWLYSKTISYYQNFVRYVTSQETTQSYETFFDRVTPRDYEIAAYLKTVRKPNDPIFVWGDSAQIYKLTETLPPGRYTVAYHITTDMTTIKETQVALIHAMPKYVIMLQNTETMPYQLKHYKVQVTFDNAIIYERTY